MFDIYTKEPERRPGRIFRLVFLLTIWVANGLRVFYPETARIPWVRWSVSGSMAVACIWYAISIFRTRESRARN